MWSKRSPSADERTAIIWATHFFLLVFFVLLFYWNASVFSCYDLSWKSCRFRIVSLVTPKTKARRERCSAIAANCCSSNNWLVGLSSAISGLGFLSLTLIAKWCEHTALRLCMCNSQKSSILRVITQQWAPFIRLERMTTPLRIIIGVCVACGFCLPTQSILRRVVASSLKRIMRWFSAFCWTLPRIRAGPIFFYTDRID